MCAPFTWGTAPSSRRTNKRTDGRTASHRCVLNRRTWSVHNRLGVTRASAGAGHSGLCLPTNVGVTGISIVGAQHPRSRGGGREERRAVHVYMHAADGFCVVVITGTAARCVRNVMLNCALRNLPARGMRLANLPARSRLPIRALDRQAALSAQLFNSVLASKPDSS